MNPDGAPAPLPGPQDRTWSHPSEIGLQSRGHSDRRRSSIIATGVVLGGLGLLLSGVLLGSTRDDGPVSARSEPTDRIERSLLRVVVVRDDRRSILPGVVVDDRGHILVPGSVGPADTIWTRDDDGRRIAAVEVASDADRGLTVLATSHPVGSAVTPVAATPVAGTRVLVALVGEDGTVAVDGTIGTDKQRLNLLELPARRVVSVSLPAATPSDSPAGATAPHVVFDRSGRLVGITTSQPHTGEAPGPTVLAARELLAAVDRLIDDAG